MAVARREYGFAGGFRRSELIALDVSDVVETDDGLRVTVRRGKTDQEAEGREVGIPFGAHPETCPVRALRAWRQIGGIVGGPLFRPVDRHGNVEGGRLTAQSVALIVKRACRRAGLDPGLYAGHSLRSGLATSAAHGGAPERAIMRQAGHRSAEVLRRHIRSGTLFEEKRRHLHRAVMNRPPSGRRPPSCCGSGMPRLCHPPG